MDLSTSRIIYFSFESSFKIVKATLCFRKMIITISDIHL